LLCEGNAACCPEITGSTAACGVRKYLINLCGPTAAVLAGREDKNPWWQILIKAWKEWNWITGIYSTGTGPIPIPTRTDALDLVGRQGKSFTRVFRITDAKRPPGQSNFEKTWHALPGPLTQIPDV